MTLRELYEQRQNQWLLPYAVHEADSGGRAHPEGDHAYRTAFQRDRDRIVHCSAFRRLDFKTQVFVPHEYDHYRTRMTHTLEVAQIGRTLGRALRLNEDVIEAVALAHDLGHSPFGHSGEAVLNELMADYGHFEHNRQSLRVVDYLEHPYPEFRGLNLCRVVRECLAKHATRYDTPICEDFDTRLRAPLEGQLVDLADEIAYTSADLEDSLAVGWLKIEQLSHLELWQRAWETACQEAPDARPIHQRIRACKAVLAMMANDVLEASGTNIAALSIDTLAAVREASRRAVWFSAKMAGMVAQMQQFLMDKVYLHPDNAQKERRSRAIIQDLFGAYTSGPDLMPERYQNRVKQEGLQRVVCDYIAGMTDRFCILEHERLAK